MNDRNSLAASVSRWLTTSNIRIRNGPHKGAVAGWLNANGVPSFVYPEITGYYLSWLASLPNKSEEVRIATSEALAWFTRIANSELPVLTRYYASPHEQDWRNGAVFTFDLAIAVRGISDSRSVTSDDKVREPLQYFLQLLTEGCFKAGARLPACINPVGKLPSRWSTREGPYQLKSAAAVLFSVHGVPGELRDAAWNTYDRWQCVSLDVTSPEDLHPALYALEGLIEFGNHGIPEAIVLARSRLGDVVAKMERWPKELRSDVVAQALRLCRLFESQHHHVAALSELLGEFVDDAGRVSFRRSGCEPVHWNAWSAMFTYASLVTDGAAGLSHGIDRYSRVQ
jgi:hypothetical protein